MTRHEQRQIKEAKQAAKIAARVEKKQDAQELRSWNKMIAKAKAKGALEEA